MKFLHKLLRDKPGYEWLTCEFGPAAGFSWVGTVTEHNSGGMRETSKPIIHVVGNSIEECLSKMNFQAERKLAAMGLA